MPSALISAEITSTCNALGDANKSTKYILGPHCKESAKDLIKYLRRDDETNSIRRQLGDTNIVHTDLIPIIVYFGDNEELFDVILRLLVNLTTPAMILYNEELPADKVERQLYQQIISHLQKYKVAFANEAFWKILRTKLTSILNIAHGERTEEKGLIAERIIILIRNVLQIPTDPETELCCHDNPNAHDTVVYVLNQAGMLDILIYIAMTPDEGHYYLHLLEIMMLMLKEQDPESLAKSDRTRTCTEKQKDENELKRIRDREVKEKMDRLMKYSSR
uniref:Protein timeless homolog n=3 Tax=Cacopsylla melanoneura TaxID=428564 RepID=A0A8D9F4A5_9HEMI